MRSRLTHSLFAAFLLAIQSQIILPLRQRTPVVWLESLPIRAARLCLMRLLIGDEAKVTTQTTKTDRERGYQFFLLAPSKLYADCPEHEVFQNERRAVLGFRLITINRAQTIFRVLRDCSEFTRSSNCRRESGERVADRHCGRWLSTVANCG